jgi:hypothetical protein
MIDRYMQQTISAHKLKVLLSITTFFGCISACNNVRNKSNGIPAVFEGPMTFCSVKGTFASILTCVPKTQILNK